MESRQGLSAALLQGGGLPLPPSALHVRGELQGEGNTTFPRIPAVRREQRLDACPRHFLRRLHCVIPFTSCASPQTGMITRNTQNSIHGLNFLTSLYVLFLPSPCRPNHHTRSPSNNASTTATVVCYKGISVTSHSPCCHGNTPVAGGSCAGGHTGPGLCAPSLRL